MKKFISLLLTLVVLVSPVNWVEASTQPSNTGNGFSIATTSSSINCDSVFYNNTIYVPLRNVFEKMGAHVFYRSRDRQFLALSRDGDVIRHNVGQNTIIINDVKKEYKYSSIIINDETYIPVDMVSAAFMTDGIFFVNQSVNIHKFFRNTDYTKAVGDVLSVSRTPNFRPEEFKNYINYHLKMPEYNMWAVMYRVNHDLDYPYYEKIDIIKYPHELSVLVNKSHKLPSGFSQYNLVHMNRAYTVNDGKEYLISAVAYDKYIQMADAAKKEGLSMKVISAYRTEQYQRNLYNNKVRTTGKINADNYSARPGHSEHQTGLAVDISSTKGSFEYTPEFRWLQKHAHEYGFILRYPKGKEWITGYAYEPWHYRYVGTKAAKIIRDEGITYEEYYVKYVDVNEFK